MGHVIMLHSISLGCLSTVSGARHSDCCAVADIIGVTSEGSSLNFYYTL
jgi:hypothetical protein